MLASIATIYVSLTNITNVNVTTVTLTFDIKLITKPKFAHNDAVRRIIPNNM